jgi:hypothetical protein
VAAHFEFITHNHLSFCQFSHHQHLFHLPFMDTIACPEPGSGPDKRSQGFELMKEHKSIQVMNNKKPISQEPKSGNGAGI